MNQTTLIKSECANYFTDSGGKGEIKNYCCLIDKQCVFYSEEKNPRCKYFEQSVLPLNPELEFKYRKERKLSTLQIQKTCKQCLQSFIPKKQNEKYCEDCKLQRKKEQTKLSVQKYRERNRVECKKSAIVKSL